MDSPIEIEAGEMEPSVRLNGIRTILFLVLVFVASFCCLPYLYSIGEMPKSDDFGQIVYAESIQQDHGVLGHFYYRGNAGESTKFYRPMFYVSLIVGERLNAYLTQGMINVLLFACAGLSVFCFISRLGWSVGIPAVFFFANPFAVEPVMWVSSRSDLLGCLFVGLAACAVTYRYLLLTSCLLLLACLSKESVAPATFAFVILSKRWGVSYRKCAGFVGASVLIYSLLRWNYLGELFGGYQAASVRPTLFTYDWCAAILKTTWCFVFPSRTDGALPLALGVLYVLGVAGLARYAIRDYGVGKCASGLLIVIMMCLPIVGLKVYPHDLMHGRFLFFPYAIVSVLLGWLSCQRGRTCAVGLLLLMLALTWSNARDYRVVNRLNDAMFDLAVETDLARDELGGAVTLLGVPDRIGGAFWGRNAEGFRAVVGRQEVKMGKGGPPASSGAQEVELRHTSGSEFFVDLK